MSNAQHTTLDRDMLALTDQAGNHYLLPLETLERGRVPAEHTAELERLMVIAAQAGTSGADAQGYAVVAGFGAGVAVALVVRAGYDIGFGLMRWYLNQEEGIAPDFTIPSSEPAPWSR